jgi:hypothetical protein
MLYFFVSGLSLDILGDVALAAWISRDAVTRQAFRGHRWWRHAAFGRRFFGLVGSHVVMPNVRVNRRAACGASVLNAWLDLRFGSRRRLAIEEHH